MTQSTSNSSQSTDAAFEELDAWSARFARSPVGQVPIDLICLSDSDSGSLAETSQAADVIRRKGRLGNIIPVDLTEASRSWGEVLTAAFDKVSAPLFVVSDASSEWNRDILERLLKSIDHCDLVLGCRPCPSSSGRIARKAARFARGVFWGAGVLDPLTPYKLGRSEVFRKFPLQSASRFVEVELIAKANFLDALIDEIELPVASAWVAPRFGPESRADRSGLFRNPAFRRPVSESVESEQKHPADRFIAPVGESPGPNEDVRTPGNDG